MRVPSASVDRKIGFVAVDATDLKTRETGLSSFTVVYSLDGATDVTMTTPTITEPDTSTMPGCYWLLLDESGMTTLASGHDTEELMVHITQASMNPVTRVIEIYRPKFTEGQSATMANSAVDADLERVAGATTDVAALATNVAAILVDTGTTLDGRLPAALVGGRMDSSVGAMAANVLTATAINPDAITAAKVAADVTTEIQSGLATAASITSLDSKIGTPAGASVSADVAAVKVDTAAILVDTGTTLDGNITAIKAKTDSLTYTVAGQVDANVQRINDVTITGDGQVGTEFGV